MNSAFAALANDRRRAILEHLHSEPSTVGSLAARFGVSQPAVSRHLKVLRACGLVELEVQGVRHIYRVRPEGFDVLRDYLEGFWDDAIPRFTLVAENMGER